jgi:hypothetical protein
MFFTFVYSELSELQDSLQDWKEPRNRRKKNDQNSRLKILLLSGEENQDLLCFFFCKLYCLCLQISLQCTVMYTPLLDLIRILGLVGFLRTVGTINCVFLTCFASL